MEATYDNFRERDEVPTASMFAISNVAELEVSPWERIGGLGTYVHLDGRGLGNSMVVEIPAGKELKEQHHFYEETVFVVGGSGRTELWNESGFQSAFNWEKGATFAIPLNVHFKHFNRSTSEPARLFSVTNMPLMMNLLHDTDLIFNFKYDFADRFGPDVIDFTKPAQANSGNTFIGNLVPSAYDVQLPPAPNRGANGGLLSLDLSNTSLGNHIAEFPSKTYKKAHRHGAGAHVILLTGNGYSLLWKGEHDEMTRVDWQPGAVMVPPEKWFHQHFNTGTTPARYLALRFGGGNHGIIPEYSDPRPTREGGDQIEYEDESPRIKETFEAEIAR
jgi:uncharacterized RmlC-like cupin family protein